MKPSTRARHGRADLERYLRRIFRQLLIRTDGDVDEALRWLEILAKRHDLFPDGYTIEDFKKSIADKGKWRSSATAPRPSPEGRARDPPRFARAHLPGLGRGSAGDHRIPKSGSGGERLPRRAPTSSATSPPRSIGSRPIATPRRAPASRGPPLRGARRRGLRDRTQDFLRHGAAPRYLPLDDALRRGPDDSRQDRGAGAPGARRVAVSQGHARGGPLRRRGAARSQGRLAVRHQRAPTTRIRGRGCGSRGNCCFARRRRTSRSS